jgi:hypothetical protein
MGGGGGAKTARAQQVVVCEEPSHQLLQQQPSAQTLNQSHTCGLVGRCEMLTTCELNTSSFFLLLLLLSFCRAELDSVNTAHHGPIMHMRLTVAGPLRACGAMTASLVTMNSLSLQYLHHDHQACCAVLCSCLPSVRAARSVTLFVRHRCCSLSTTTMQMILTTVCRFVTSSPTQPPHMPRYAVLCCPQ